MGPTASGKTDLAIEIAKRYASDLVSVDSALVYRDMNIGTAKPEPQILNDFPHALVDILSPEQSYSAADFARDAKSLISQANSNEKLSVLVGGTMLYYRALFQGFDDLPEADESIRAVLNKRLQNEGSHVLHAELATCDPSSANRIHPNDPQRITRALEVYEITGQPLSHLQSQSQQQHSQRLHYDGLNIILLPEDRAVLHKRIAQRFEQMLDMGFVNEVEQLLQKYSLHKDMPSMRSVGYRQVMEYLNGDYNYNTMQEKGIIATRQLAKRQHTWLRKEQGAHIFIIENDYLDDALLLVDEFVGN